MFSPIVRAYALIFLRTHRLAESVRSPTIFAFRHRIFVYWMNEPLLIVAVVAGLVTVWAHSSEIVVPAGPVVNVPNVRIVRAPLPEVKMSPNGFGSGFKLPVRLKPPVTAVVEAKPHRNAESPG